MSELIDTTGPKAPCIAGTRIRVSLVIRLVRGGASVRDNLGEHGWDHISQEQLIAALEYYARNASSIDDEIAAEDELVTETEATHDTVDS